MISYLQNLPVSEIKIDKSFVSALNDEPRSAAIVRSVIDLGRNLNLVVVAEGIEDSEIWNALSAMRCDLGQGFYICHPLAPEALMEWLTLSPTGATHGSLASYACQWRLGWERSRAFPRSTNPRHDHEQA